MTKLSYIAVTAATLALLFLLVEYSIPAAKEWAFINECNRVDWITDTCVESPLFWEYVK